MTELKAPREIITDLAISHVRDATAPSARRASDALAALTEALGTSNDQNPWLGVTAGVALLKIDNAKLQARLARLTDILSQNGGWCSHGVLMDQPYHPRCSNCVLMQARAVLAAAPAARGATS